MDWIKFVRDFASNAPWVGKEYFEVHEKRFVRSFEVIEEFCNSTGLSNLVGLDIASAGLFPLGLEKYCGFKRCDVLALLPKRFAKFDYEISLAGENHKFSAFNHDLETSSFPIADNTYDFIMFFEVIEHLGLDPMFALCEFNRILKPGGKLFITTPNASSARCIKQLLEGWSPQFHLAFNLDGSRDRHNLEYAPRLLRDVCEAAGFSRERLWTEDLYEISAPEVLDLMAEKGYPLDDRADSILCLVEKEGDPRDRFPGFLYH